MMSHLGEVRVRDARNGEFVIDEFEVSEKAARQFNVYQMMSYSSRYIRPGKYVRLCAYNGKGSRTRLIMSNTPAEIRDHQEFYANASGRVLICGLGLGMILHAIAAKEVVSEIVVVEKQPEIIDMVAPHFPEKRITILQGDAFAPASINGLNGKFDVMYFDIWDEISGDAYDEMIKLASLWRRWKAQGARSYCWCKKEARARAR
ncbi:hypothetical protein [uncultured Victivallis sp.]|uniref:hypothetical protein n=1 Tax=uncultured Victivallis sp. TaxID=354118 RepID=UPI0025919B60|nr:hypothetical protein [uncultured Victivallis sp.]